MTGVNIEQARAAKEKAKQQLSGNPLIVGIGLTRIGGDYAVKINVAAAPSDAPRVPDSIDGVPVRCEVVGKLKPR